LPSEQPAPRSPPRPPLRCFHTHRIGEIIPGETGDDRQQ